MAEVVQRVWRSGPRKIRRSSWGYTAMIGGKQMRRSDAKWSKDDAQAALAAALLEPPGHGGGAPTVCRTLAEVAEEYLAHKADAGKRSLKEDRRILTKRILPAFGAEHRPRRHRAHDRKSDASGSGR